MEMTTRPLFALYVMWHPSYREGREIADRLRRHFGRDLYRVVREELGVSVLERSEPVQDARTPLPIDWDDAEFTAVVVLAEAALVDDYEWVDHCARHRVNRARERDSCRLLSGDDGSSGA